MRSLYRTIFLIAAIFDDSAIGQQATPAVLTTRGPQSAPSTLFSPDHAHYVAWSDVEAGTPIGLIRPVVVRHAGGQENLFSFVTIPGQATQAAWNSASTRCVITDQPDNGYANAWLIYKEGADKWLWRRLDPLAPLEADHLRALGGRALFRPFLDKIEWLSDTKLRFLVRCNLNNPELTSSGRYWATIDVQTQDAVPQITKAAEE